MNFNDIKNWHKTMLCQKVKSKLEQRGFEVLIVNNKEEIKEFLEQTIQPDYSVGLGGSVTLRELEIDTFIKARGNEVFNHWEDGLTKDDVMNIIRKQPQSDVFLTSSNAITMEGQLVNIDTTGNRVASMIFGPKHVIVVAGANKITKNIDEAILRIKNHACPQNSKRKNLNSPCEKTGYCLDCKDSPASICKITTIIEHKPPSLRFTVVLLPYDLGF